MKKVYNTPELNTISLQTADVITMSASENGIMTSYKRVGRGERAENKRYFFICQAQGGEPRYNSQSYVDCMSKEAIDEFISSTHEGFKSAVGREFGKTVLPL